MNKTENGLLLTFSVFVDIFSEAAVFKKVFLQYHHKLANQKNYLSYKYYHDISYHFWRQ